MKNIRWKRLGSLLAALILVVGPISITSNIGSITFTPTAPTGLVTYPLTVR